MKTFNTISSNPTFSQLTTRWADLKNEIDSIKDVFLIGLGDKKLFKELQDYQEEFDQLDLLLGEIFLVNHKKVLGWIIPIAA